MRNAGLGIVSKHVAMRTGSLSLLTRLEKYKTLEGHEGCVNTVKFTRDGNSLISGSDDHRINLYNWRTGDCRVTLETLHRGNIFQAEQLLHCDNSIVSCGADGEVQMHSLRDGGKCAGDQTTVLGYHSGRVHKLSLNPVDPNSFLSCGEDGVVNTYDVRTNDSRIAVKFLNNNRRKVPINSVNHDPLSLGRRFALAGSDKYVRVYDYRYLKESEPVQMYTANDVQTGCYITCLDYSCHGELLATFSEDFIYLFPKFGSDNKTVHSANQEEAETAPAEVCSDMQVYKGHLNCDTVKGVTFFGPNDEFVASGSDCGHCFIWDKHNADVLQAFKADKDILNCIQPHPHESMTLATSGLDHNCKIWQPTASHSTVPEDLDEIVEKNMRSLEAGGGWQQQANRILYALLNDVDVMIEDDEGGRVSMFDYYSNNARFAQGSGPESSDGDTDGDVNNGPEAMMMEGAD
ncbi:WD40 repeat domain-containing protein [Chloropicon primus]|uniref:WD40 repeat domain-containing protein n=2 Tax=Chloropicon primus TaxID=1764295 RepID=A0A5B8MZX9_9CHLO|nr:WD40 repeat domain-containing protein [Chloropicon primus]UPR05284.1 WD40 repeat domain-containing protein [Chloropicon primus]|eukprot:QDZ26083.1 WD40 repeat domain-containing protein [Chloropicon primus]